MSLGSLYTDTTTPRDIISPIIDIDKDTDTTMGDMIDVVEIEPISTYTYSGITGAINEIHGVSPSSVISDEIIDIDTNVPVPVVTALDPFTALKAWVETIAKSGIDETRVRAIVSEQIAKVKPRKIEVKVGSQVTKLDGIQHYQFELVLKTIASGVNLAMTGTAATSKTTMAIQAATALGKSYMLFRPMHSPSQAEGYNSATGEYIQSNLYRAHKAGMVAIFDEFDASDPAITLVINSLLDNKTFTYPNGETVCNPDFQVVCTMNTKGTGSDRKFVGRNRLDAATLDRFVVLEVERDLSLEANIIGIVEAQKTLNIKGGRISEPTADDWLKIVREERETYSKSHPDKIVSMRAVRDGWKLLQAGIGLSWTTKMCVTK